MALESRDSTQFASFEPPLPIRLYPIKGFSSTTDDDVWGGSGTDGRKYGKFTLDTTVWTRGSGQAITPMVPGERFQVVTTKDSSTFPDYTNIPTFATEATETTASPDLLNYLPLASNLGTKNGATDPLTVAGIVPHADNGNLWDIYFSPFIDGVSIDTTQDGIITIPEPRNGIWLGQLGNINSINYSYSKPGGPTSLTLKLLRPPTYRTQAMDPGRVIQGFRGGSCIWEGINQEPTPGTDGWTLTANGAGTYGSVYTAIYSSWNADSPLSFAISRGMRWKNYGIGKPAGIYLGQAQDSGSMVITDFLNLLCTGGTLYWSVEPPKGSSVPAGPWEIRLRQFPTDLLGSPVVTDDSTATQWNVTNWQRIDLKRSAKRLPPDLYIINTNPVPRTVTDDYNSLVIKFQATADKTATSTQKAQAATYKTISVDNPASVIAHQRNEYYLDISASGVMTEANVVKLGKNILSHYVRAAFASDITVQPGQLVNNGGVPVDLGVDWSGCVAGLQVDNSAFGGEVNYNSPTFLIGNYTFDDDSQTATVSPYQSVKTDISSIIESLYPGKFA